MNLVATAHAKRIPSTVTHLHCVFQCMCVAPDQHCWVHVTLQQRLSSLQSNKQRQQQQQQLLEDDGIDKCICCAARAWTLLKRGRSSMSAAATHAKEITALALDAPLPLPFRHTCSSSAARTITLVVVLPTPAPPLPGAHPTSQTRASPPPSPSFHNCSSSPARMITLVVP